MRADSQLVAMRSRRSQRLRALLLVVATMSLAGMAWLEINVRSSIEKTNIAVERSSSTWYVDMMANRWVPLETSGRNPVTYRADHGGAAYAPDSNTVLLFGSDSHLRNFDNRVLELRLNDLSWNRPYAGSPRFAQRTDARGRRIAGIDQLLPWPMHIYDAMVYDTSNDEMLVFSGAKHSFIATPGDQSDPVWAYSPILESWRIVETIEGEDPNFFAAGAVFDSVRDTIVAYGSTADVTPFIPLGSEFEIVRTGVWELGPDRKTWVLASPGVHHWGWFNAEYDKSNRAMIVVGGNKNDSAIWQYETGRQFGAEGKWEKRAPVGDDCPGGYYFPASYDSKHEVTLFMPPDRSGKVTATCIYDAGKNITYRLPDADLPWVGLNYTLVYASKIDLFILVTGSFSRGEPTSVWALRLDTEIFEE